MCITQCFFKFRTSLKKVVTEHAIVTKRHAPEIFHLSSNMVRSAILHKSLAFLEVFITQLGMMRFCNISAYLSLVTLRISKPESSLSSEKKGLHKGRRSKSAPHRDNFVVQWNFHKSSLISSSPDSAVV